MLPIAIAGAASSALPSVNFHSHGHMHGKKSSQLESQGESAVGSVGQMPVGASQGLLGSMLQSLQQVIGQQSGTGLAAAATSTTAATGPNAASAAPSIAATPASPAVQQELNGFMHSLFQVLRQEGAAGASAATTAAGAGTAAATTGVGQYQGSLASSLQSLIQQIGSNGPTTPAVANLESSFNTLVQGMGGSGATASASSATGGAAASTQSSTASLQSFLNNLLQKLQSDGLQAANLSGSNVNAKV